MSERIKNMTDAETVAHLRAWTTRGSFSWPTDACGYEQHMRFVRWRNERTGLGEPVNHLEYADALEAGSVPVFTP